MADSLNNGKLRLLYLADFLMHYSDEAHPKSIQSISTYLSQKDISCERKSLYSDIAALQNFGMDICHTNGKNCGYYVASRTFELPELQLLIDSVLSSRFITERKTVNLVKKLMTLASTYESKGLSRQIYVKNRIKTMNESIYYNVDHLLSAIEEDHQISYLYFDYDLNKNKQYRHGGEAQVTSPFALTWDDENYYLLGYDKNAGIIKHYRVDRMEQIRSLKDSRIGKEVFSSIDMSQYTTQVFSMFAGPTTAVTLRFSNSLLNVILDKFGHDILINKSGKDHFTVSLLLSVSPQFFGWLAGLGKEASILRPVSVADAYKEHLRSILKSQSEIV